MRRSKRLALAIGVWVSLACAGSAQAQTPEVVDRNLGVRTAALGLSQPVAMAFIGRGDALVLEKASGRVQRMGERREEARVLVGGEPARECVQRSGRSDRTRERRRRTAGLCH